MALGYDELRRVTEEVRLPAVVVDLDAFDRNLDRHLSVLAAWQLPLRVATKSLRVPALIERVLGRRGARGLMCFHAGEAARLADRGIDDLFVAYPVFGTADLRALCDLTARGVTVSVAVDSEEGLRRYSEVASGAGVSLNVVLCVDMSLKMANGRVHVGVRRSPLHTSNDVVGLAERARRLPGIVVYGILGYEAQVAGLGDASAYDSVVVRLGKRVLRHVSMRELAARRSRIVEALRSRGFELAFVNGGGTGSLDLTSPITGVTEVTAGSGLYKPLLFDAYESAFVKSLEPSCFFALEVTRRPGPRVVTCAGGGYVASGAAGPDKLPRPFAPSGLELLPMEGAGEVQTPLRGYAADALRLGDPVFFRHAKAGELMERFNEVVLLRDGRAVDRVKTYRGEGWSFA